MPTIPIYVVTFVAFAATVFVQFWISDAVKRRLIDRHPETWLKISRESGFFSQNPAFRFLRRRMDRELDDPVIAKLARRHRLTFAASLIIWLAWIAEIFLLRP